MTGAVFSVFGGDLYYPSGGAADWLGTFPSLSEATAFAQGYVKGESLRWAHVATWEDGRPVIAWESES